MGNIEILAPAGSMESVYPAVRLGADAIYFGMKRFGARANAFNFDKLEAKQLIEYCHAKGVKAYVTLNTLIKDEEFADVVNIAEYLCSLSVDAIIVQDIGLAKILRKCSKDVRLHGSTQMSIHTLEGVKLLQNIGFNRVVLSRELSKAEIQEIRNGSDIELEVFVHGALCMSVSGQCYYSSVLGGRSGNRGLCAQPCRLPMRMNNSNNSHVLSLKDMSHVEFIKELAEIGVTSVKIEGRMKRPEYVAVAVDACRAVADGGILSDVQKDRLISVFSRSGFTSGYYTGLRGRDMFGHRTKKDVTALSEKKLSEIRSLYNKETQNIPIRFFLIMKKNETIKLSVIDDEKNECFVEGDKVERARNVPLTEERCRDQLLKTGGTMFKCNLVEICMDSDVSVPISTLNDLRRRCLNDLEKKRSTSIPISFSTSNIDTFKEHLSKKPTIRARFVNAQIPDCFKCCEIVYVPFTLPLEKILTLQKRGFNVGIEFPRGMFGQEEKICKKLENLQGFGIQHVLIGNLGAINLVKNFDYIVHGSFALNVMNSFSLDAIKDLGVHDVELSFEMTLNEIKKLRGEIPRGIIVYGRLPLMLTRNCPGVNTFNNCAGNCGKCEIADRKNVKFPMLCDGVCTEILNSVPLYMGDRKNEIHGVDFFTLRFTVENSVESEENFQVFNNSNKLSKSYTRGLYYRSVD